ncbi:DEAD/DEAH box helicase [Candidatus Uhrbacteria bacterium]|nr:DEAD/DEAH box helicase [Candidatus Uhrbacteria bacterium]
MDTKQSFYHLGIAPRLLEILDKLQFVTPTPIQQKSIPVALEGKDVIGIAQTGTGKTLAFGIPMIQRLAQVKGKGLVILPTRELALQVDESYQKIGRSIGLRTAVLIGGASISNQVHMIRRRPHVVIGTPGRIIDHLHQKSLDLRDVSVLVLDEADRMLDMGFAPQINEILRSIPKERQTMLFSATMPDDIVRIASRQMKLPVRVEIAPTGATADNVEQELYVVSKDQKDRLLDKILSEYHGSVLVFTRTKYGAKRVCRRVRTMGHSSAELHSERSLAQRKEALEGFKRGVYRVLVATDIAARGIDVTGIELVINYDIPEHPEDYVHRIGRTGRAGMTGTAISFATREQGSVVRDIEKFVRVALPVSRLPELPPERLQGAFEPSRQPFRRGSRRPSVVGRGSLRPHRRRPFQQRHHSIFGGQV